MTPERDFFRGPRDDLRVTTSTGTGLTPACGYCGGYHSGICPRIKRIEYHQNGTIARVEFFDTLHDPHGYPLGPVAEKSA